jgi:hypothetical protein
VITLVLFLVLRNPKFSLTTLLITFGNCIRLVAAVITIGGGLPLFPGTASSCGVASALEESVSMVAPLRGANKLRVTTTFGGGVCTASEAAVRTAFLEAGAVSSVLCLFRLRTSLKPSSSVAVDPKQ